MKDNQIKNSIEEKYIEMQYRLQKQIEFRMPDIKQFSYTDIIIDNEIYGRVLRTHSGVKPIFLSIGNKIYLDTAMQVTNTLVTKDSHIPLPTRLADIMTHEIRKKYAIGIDIDFP